MTFDPPYSIEEVMMARIAIVATVLLLAPVAASAAWTPGGTALCTYPGGQNVPALTSDGAGGAIIAWIDLRNFATSGADIYAQHVLSSGDVDPTWPIGGVALCTAAGDQNDVVLTADGAGGAWAVWEDFRGDIDVYAQHLLASGALDASFPNDGRVLCDATGFQQGALMVSDGAGGAFVAWTDSRVEDNENVYAHHILNSGALDSHWSNNGTVVCNAAGFQGGCALAADGAGGMIVTWEDGRGTDLDVYAQRMTAGGSRASGWTSNGEAVCTASGDQASPEIARDGAGGAFIAWEDSRNNSSIDVYAHHIQSAGAVDPVWPAQGLVLGTIDDVADFGPRLTGDPSGGVFVVWETNGPAPSVDFLMATHLLSSGALHPSWPAGGTMVCDSVDYSVHIVGDAAGGAFVQWLSFRGPYGVVAHHLLANGVDPTRPANGLGVSGDGYGRDYPTLIADGAGGAISTWTSGSHDCIYALGIPSSGDIVAVAPRTPGGRLRLASPRPQPLTHRTSLALELPAASPVTAEVLDVSGRIIRRLSRGAIFAAGRSEISWDGLDDRGKHAASGVYFVRVTTPTGSASQRVVVLGGN